MPRFCHFELRTPDVDAARDFYAAVPGFPRAHAIVQLPAEAAARGAPAHWLGHIGVDDVEASARTFVAHGGARLGPTRGTVALLRDGGGAVLALTSTPPAEAERVAWLTLHTPALEAALRGYAAVFGWQATRTLELGTLGHGHDFAWAQGGPSVGSMMDSAGRPGVHPHWLFHFGVPSLDAAVDAIRARGGRVAGVFAEVAVCEDPQGAAFAVRAQ
jgi:uncharacterized protein